MLALLLVCFAATIVGVGVVVVTGVGRRQSLLPARTCLLCGSASLISLGEPQYRCAKCGFDTTKADGLTNELALFQDSGSSAHHRARARAHILAHMNADGDVGSDGAHRLDFEHAVEDDYDGVEFVDDERR